MALRPRINEFVFNHVGTDTAEFIEIKADPGIDLSGYSLIIVDGDGTQAGIIDNVISPGTTNAAGYYVTPFFGNALQNGSQTLLLVQGYTGAAVGSDLDTNNDGVLDNTPWADVVDAIAVRDTDAADSLYLGAPVLLPNGSLTVGGASRIPDGQDTDSVSDWLVNDFDGAGLPGFTGTPVEGEALNTPGASNQLAVVVPPNVTVTAIHDIQAARHNSPFAGQRIQTNGIVTAVDTAGGIGYYLQDPNPDANDATSEAIFVFTNSVAALPGVGDAVTVTGTVSEFLNGSAANLGLTQLTGPTTTVSSRGNALPATVLIGAGGRTPPSGVIYDDAPGNLNQGVGDFDRANEGIDFFESLENMRVTVNNAVVIQGTNGFAETWVLADLGAASSVRTPRGGVLLREGDDNPERILVAADPGVLPGNTFSATVGDTFQTLTGVLTYNFGNYRINLTQQPTLTPAALPQEVTSLRGDADTLSFAEWNVENLDPSDPKFDAVASIIGTNLGAPDILALQEIQDSNGATNNGITDATVTAAKLVAAVKLQTGITYAYADIAPADGTSGGEPGGNIRNGFLYNPARVQLGALSRISDNDLSNGDAFASSRLPLVGTFRFNGQDVTLVNVHYTSKGGSGSPYGSVQPPPNGGEAARVAQAIETRRILDARFATNPDEKLAVLGDHNEFSWNASQQVLTSDGQLIDLEQLQPLNERYTYTFDGNSQALDHTLASNGLLDAVSAFDTVHVNSEYADAARVSDHDPSVTTVLLPKLDLAPPAFLPGAIDPAATRTLFATNDGNAVGGAAADILFGAPGNGSLTGGSGADLFAFLAGNGGGTITVTDFVSGQDRIGLFNFAADAAASAYAGRTTSGDGTTLTLADGSRVVLTGVTDLSQAAFI